MTLNNIRAYYILTTEMHVCFENIKFAIFPLEVRLGQKNPLIF